MAGQLILQNIPWTVEHSDGIRSPVPIEGRHFKGHIGASVIADAMIGRLLSGAHKLELKGDFCGRKIQQKIQQKVAVA